MNKWFCIILILFLVCLLWMGRYSITSVGAGQSYGYAYRLDRFTGEVGFLIRDTERATKWMPYKRVFAE